VDPQPQPATGSVSPETQRTWKSEAAAFAAGRVANGATLGLGSGSTAELAIQALAQRIKNEGLRDRCPHQ
jgi:ribose 5-phosphate isomerase